MNPLEDLVSSFMAMGGRPAGDPAALFDQAQRLTQLADRLQSLMPLLTQQARISYYEGPRADAHAADVEQSSRDLNALAQEMHQRAQALFATAGQLAHSQVAWDQRLNNRVAGIPSGIVNQARRLVGW